MSIDFLYKEQDAQITMYKFYSKIGASYKSDTSNCCLDERSDIFDQVLTHFCSNQKDDILDIYNEYKLVVTNKKNTNIEHHCICSQLIYNNSIHFLQNIKNKNILMICSHCKDRFSAKIAELVGDDSNYKNVKCQDELPKVESNDELPKVESSDGSGESFTTSEKSFIMAALLSSFGSGFNTNSPNINNDIQNNRESNKYVFIYIFILLIIVIFLNYYFTVNTIKTKWYNELKKPNGFLGKLINNKTVSIVWIIIYSLLSYSVYTILRDEKNIYNHNILMLLFLVNIVLNVVWYYAFYLQDLKLCFMVILLLLFTTVAITYIVYKINRFSCLLIIPYIIWLLLLSYYTWELLKLNT